MPRLVETHLWLVNLDHLTIIFKSKVQALESDVIFLILESSAKFKQILIVYAYRPP